MFCILLQDIIYLFIIIFKGKYIKLFGVKLELMLNFSIFVLSSGFMYTYFVENKLVQILHHINGHSYVFWVTQGVSYFKHHIKPSCLRVLRCIDKVKFIKWQISNILLSENCLSYATTSWIVFGVFRLTRELVTHHCW